MTNEGRAAGGTEDGRSIDSVYWGAAMTGMAAAAPRSFAYVGISPPDFADLVDSGRHAVASRCPLPRTGLAFPGNGHLRYRPCGAK